VQRNTHVAVASGAEGGLGRFPHIVRRHQSVASTVGLLTALLPLGRQTVVFCPVPDDLAFDHVDYVFRNVRSEIGDALDIA